MKARKMALLVLASIFLTICLYCGPGVPQRRLTLSDFSFLKRGMSLAEVINKIGRVPDRDIGSGIFIIQYDLFNDCIVELVFFDSRAEKLVDAMVRCQGGKVMHLLEPIPFK